MKRAHVFISGIVQGVYFRDSTRREAFALGISGWVRNLPDGRVEAVFEGDENNVDELVRWCHDGPAGAVVTHVDVAQEPYTGEYRTFAIQVSHY